MWFIWEKCKNKFQSKWICTQGEKKKATSAKSFDLVGPVRRRSKAACFWSTDGCWIEKKNNGNLSEGGKIQTDSCDPKNRGEQLAGRQSLKSTEKGRWGLGGAGSLSRLHLTCRGRRWLGKSQIQPAHSDIWGSRKQTLEKKYTTADWE